MHLPTLLTLTTTLLTTTTLANPAPAPLPALAPRDETRPTLLCPTSSASHLPGYTFTFLPTLSYTFLTTSPSTVAQICSAGGTLVASALQQSATGDDAPVSWGIEPLDLEEEAGYVAGVLVVRAVGGVLETLNELVGNRTSVFYEGQTDDLARQVAAQVDDKFEVTLRDI